MKNQWTYTRGKKECKYCGFVVAATLLDKDDICRKCIAFEAAQKARKSRIAKKKYAFLSKSWGDRNRLSFLYNLAVEKKAEEWYNRAIENKAEEQKPKPAPVVVVDVPFIGHGRRKFRD
jgi:hypothetical protein